MGNLENMEDRLKQALAPLLPSIEEDCKAALAGVEKQCCEMSGRCNNLQESFRAALRNLEKARKNEMAQFTDSAEKAMNIFSEAEYVADKITRKFAEIDRKVGALIIEERRIKQILADKWYEMQIQYLIESRRDNLHHLMADGMHEQRSNSKSSQSKGVDQLEQATIAELVESESKRDLVESIKTKLNESLHERSTELMCKLERCLKEERSADESVIRDQISE